MDEINDQVTQMQIDVDNIQLEQEEALNSDDLSNDIETSTDEMMAELDVLGMLFVFFVDLINFWYRTADRWNWAWNL